MNKIKKKILLSLIPIICFTAGFAQSPPWKAENGVNVIIPARTNLDVRWEATNKFPRKVWMYELLPNFRSAQIISNLMAMCFFEEKNKMKGDTNEIVFQSSDHFRTLFISFSSGEIDYQAREAHYSPTNLAVNVPTTNQLPELAKNVLNKLHINFSDITGWIGTNKMGFSEPMTIFYVGDTEITNVAYRTVYFRRSVDGMPVTHFNHLNFGEHGKISKIDITWPNLKRIKSYRTVSSKDVINFLRNGNAVRGPVPTDIGDIDWSSIKSVTVTKAIPSYVADAGQLYPFLHLDVTLDIGGQNVRMAMNCPIFDETK
jgi:hypothetical protein